MKKQRSRSTSPIYIVPELHALAPRVTMLGRGHAIVENHKGIREMSYGMISLNTSCGVVRFAGEELRITRMSPGVISLKGDIRDIKWME